MIRGDHEDDDADARDVDARAPRGLGVAADGIDVAAERRALREERQADEEDRPSGAPRAAARAAGSSSCVSGVPSAHAAGLCAWLQIATVPKLAIATPANFATAIHGVGRQTGTSLA